MIVYRFEKNGIGPYVGGQPVPVGSFYRKKTKTRTQKVSAKKFEQKLLSSKVNRFEAWQKSHEDKQYIFGCASKELLRAYFAGNFKDLFKRGYRIKRYKVPDNEVIDMVVEVAFPVKYHKLQSVKKIKKTLTINA